jgi:hypothetical protein
MNERYYVICGTRDEFVKFAMEKSADMWMTGNTSVSLSNFVYVNGTEQLKGVSSPHGWFIGSWRDRSNIHEIIFQLGYSYRGVGEKIPESIINIAREMKILT